MDTRTAEQARISQPRHVCVVAPDGALGAEDVDRLDADLRAAAGTSRLLVVDLIAVPSVDEAVVDLLVETAAGCKAAGTPMVVANAPRQPWKALTEAGLPGVLRLHRRTPQPLSDLVALLED